jgi:hypothetical protein
MDGLLSFAEGCADTSNGMAGFFCATSAGESRNNGAAYTIQANILFITYYR